MQVIDAEIVRRQLLEEVPIPSTNEEPVLFDTAEIPWWAWIRRFHLPEVKHPLPLLSRSAPPSLCLVLFQTFLRAICLCELTQTLFWQRW